jgi:TonB family protein
VKFAIFALAFAALGVAPARADAACTASLRAHLHAGSSALARGAANDRISRTRPAAADYLILARDVDLASAEIGTCPDPRLRRTFYELSAWKSIFATSQANVDDNVARSNARSLRDKVAAYFRYGGASADPQTYAVLKDAVRDSYERNHLFYCSPERTAASCAMAAHVARVRADASARAALVTLRNQRPTCAVPNAPATPIQVYEPDYPDVIRSENLTGTTLVRITIGTDGSVGSPAIYKSSGNGFLDRAAIQAARLTTFRAARRACRPVADSYIFRSDFTP